MLQVHELADDIERFYQCHANEDRRAKTTGFHQISQRKFDARDDGKYDECPPNDTCVRFGNFGAAVCVLIVCVIHCLCQPCQTK